MTFDKKPISRLTIFFILAVVLSGSILTWFSINNISNLKKLTEKRVLEEQRELSLRFLNAIRINLDKVIPDFDNESFTPAELKDSLRKKASEYSFISQTFILNNTGELLNPNFIGIPDNALKTGSSEIFKTAFRTGETAEFAEKDFIKAMRFYLSCLNHSSDSNDSAKTLNSLGRISVKLNNTRDAFNYYTSLISRHYSVADENGNPYVYYALPQLMKISDENNSQMIMQTIIFCLEKIETGSVPLTFNSEDLLTNVKDWLKNNNFYNSENSAGIEKLTSEISQQGWFAMKYGNELRELVNKENLGKDSFKETDYKIVNTASENSASFFMINTTSSYQAGFMIDPSKLFDSILKTAIQKDFEFDFNIEFPEKYKTGLVNDNLIYLTQLTPFFPDQQIEISLVNKDLIKDLVNRRALIYGIASLLLIVAMGLGVALILRDMARERNLARLRADFISNVTHELKTPLTSVRMYAESLLMGRVRTEEARKEYLEVVVNESERLKRMINNILEYSKSEKGKTEYHFQESNLASIIRSAIKEMSYWFEKEYFEIVTDLNEEINSEVDPEKLKQVIENLLSNAIKYSTDVKQVFIRLQKESDNILIEVEDRGIGIPSDKISHIFEPFYRAEQKESISGTGLGLTVVKEIIDAHRGTISVVSDPGKGSRFSVRLPGAGK